MTGVVPTAPSVAEGAAARRDLAAIVAWDLDRCDLALPDRPLDDVRWGAVVRLARAQRAEAPLGLAVAAGALPATGRQREIAAGAYRAAMSLAVLLERDLLTLHRRLAAAGIVGRVVKGLAVAHLDEPDPAARGFGDVDLLVPARDLPAAVAIVEAAGGVRRIPEPRPGYDRRFGKGVSLRLDTGGEVDLHRTLAPGPFGLRVDPAELLAGGEPFRVGGVELVALDRSGRFLHACYHAVLGDAVPRLTTLRDLVHTAPADDRSCRAVLDRAARWQAEAVVGAAVDRVVAELAWRPPEPFGSWARHAPRPARQQRWLRAYGGADRLPALQAIQGIGAVDGAADRLAYARAIALPARSSHRTPTVERYRRGARALARLVRP